MNETRTLGLTLLGCGTVGGGVAELIRGGRTGSRLVLQHVVVRNISKPRPGVPADLIHADWRRAVEDPAVDVVVEVVGGTTAAKEMTLAALHAGKHVVTANKALLAEYGREVFAAARDNGASVGFEAAVAGGIPIVKAMLESFAPNRITAIQGILNGTSNFILSRMTESGADYDAALAEAQRLGYAEADPALDVDGSDAAHKLTVLAQLAFGATPDWRSIDRRGIVGLDPMDLRFAAELGYAVKLLAEGWRTGDAVSLHVSPVMLRQSDMLARVNGAANAVRVHGDLVGEAFFAGPGAGRLPTASSVLADLNDLVHGRTPATFTAANLWSDAACCRLAPADRVSSRFYLRVLVRDEPGALADVGRILANQRVSIASVVQHEAVDGHPEQAVPLVVMTHAVETARFRRAVAELNHLTVRCGPIVWLPVTD